MPHAPGGGSISTDSMRLRHALHFTWFLHASLVCLSVNETAHAQEPSLSAPPPVTPLATRRAHFEFRRDHPDWITTWHASGSLHRAYGPGIRFSNPEPTRSELLVSASQFLRTHRDLLGISEQDLELRFCEPVGPLWMIIYRQLHAGVPVDGGRFDLRVRRDGNLVMFGGRIRSIGTPDLQVQQEPRALKRIAGNELERRTGLAPGRELQWTHQGLHLAEGPSGVRLCARLDATSRIHGSWRVDLDPRTGEVLTFSKRSVHGTSPHASASRSPFTVSGTVTAAVHAGNNASSTPVGTPVPGIQVSVGGLTTNTNALGMYSIAGTGPLTVSLTGPATTVFNGTATTPTTQAFGNQACAQFDPLLTQPTQAERDAFVFVTRTVQWYQSNNVLMPPALQSLMNTPLPATVGVPQTLGNGFYNPATIGSDSITLGFDPGTPALNSAFSETFVAHEVGHAIHHRILEALFGIGTAGFFSTHLEGIADVVGISVAGSPIFGAGLPFPPTMNCSRDLSIVCTYPTGCISATCPGVNHDRGKVIAGAFWALRTDPSVGATTTDQLFLAHLAAGPFDEQESLLELLLLDDNDANLLNGTTHGNQIQNHFTAVRGIPFPIERVEIDHRGLLPTLYDTNPSATPRFRVTVNNSFGVLPGQVRLHRSINGGAYMTSVLGSGTGTFTFTMPAHLTRGDIVDYYFDVALPSGCLQTAPPQAPASNTFRMGAYKYLNVTYDSFDGATSQWAPESAFNNDWQRATPANVLPWDPTTALTQPNCFGNDLTLDGRYLIPLGLGNNHLVSQPFSTLGRSNLDFRYQRWLTVDNRGGVAPSPFIIATAEVSGGTQSFSSANLPVLWQNFSGDPFTSCTPVGPVNNPYLVDSSWRPHTLALPASMAGIGNAQLAFRLTTSGFSLAQLGGWNVDNAGVWERTTQDFLSESQDPSGLRRLDITSEPGNQILIGVSFGARAPTFIESIGMLAFDPASPNTLLLPTATVPASGTYTIFFPLPTISGTYNFQAIVISALDPTVATISNVDQLIVP